MNLNRDLPMALLLAANAAYAWFVLRKYGPPGLLFMLPAVLGLAFMAFHWMRLVQFDQKYPTASTRSTRPDSAPSPSSAPHAASP